MKTFLLLLMLTVSMQFVTAQGWGQTQKLTASDRELGAEFACAVAMDGNFAVIGARDDDNPNNNEGAAYIFQNDGNGTWTETQKIVAPDGRSSDRFGWSVAIDANTIMVSARGHDYNENNQDFKESAGAVYFFENDGSGNWNFTQKIVAPDRAASDVFGESVALSGDYAIIMAPLEDEDENGNNTLNAAGSGYVFERDGTGTWDFVQKIVVSNRAEADTIGREGSVDIDGNTITIGVQLDDTDENNANELINAGAVYTFQRNGSGVWNETQKIVASSRVESYSFGIDVAIDGDFMVVGSSGQVNFDGGPTYVFKNVNGMWQELQQLLPSNMEFPLNFGKTVDIKGNRLVVGNLSETLNGFGSAGTAYVFENNGSDVWSQTARIGTLDADTSDNFSFSIAISGDFIIGGAYREDEDVNGQNPLSQSGSAYVFDINEPNNIPTLNVSENDFNVTIKTYPNPIKNRLNFDFGRYLEAVTIIVVNILGQEVISKNYINISHIQLDFQEQVKGVYLVKITSENNSISVLKVVKH